MIKAENYNETWRIEEISWYEGIYKRPRPAGCNARLGEHGSEGEVPLARIRIGGITGFGWSTITPKQARQMVGLPVRALFDEEGLVRDCYRYLEFPLLDWAGQVAKEPVYRLIGSQSEKDGKKILRVPVYDTSIYFDELSAGDDREGVEIICREIEQGMAAGQTNFKVKIGRPGMWMGITDGLRRDIAILHAVRNKIGPDGILMADANNGYNFNLAKCFLKETSSAKLYWMEEAFHEDDQLYSRLREWMAEEKISTKIADGEGYASPAIEEWAKKGLIDVLQYDLREYGFCRWIRLGRELSRYGVLAAPHNYGSFYGNFVQAHFAAVVDNFTLGEWDQAKSEGIDTSAYRIEAGKILFEDSPGFGLKLDNFYFDKKVRDHGWTVAAERQLH